MSHPMYLSSATNSDGMYALDQASLAPKRAITGSCNLIFDESFDILNLKSIGFVVPNCVLASQIPTSSKSAWLDKTFDFRSTDGDLVLSSSSERFAELMNASSTAVKELSEHRFVNGIDVLTQAKK